MAKRTTSPKSKAAPAIDATTRILVLTGKEHMLKRQRFTELRDAMRAAHGEIDTFELDGNSATLSDVFDELRGYSLMATYKLVVVDAADEFVKKHRKVMEEYAKNPVDHATLVLRCDTWNAGNLDKLIAAHGAIIKCDLLKPPEAVAWLTERCEQKHGTKITRSAAQLLVERVGTMLAALDAEAGKLALMAEAGKPVDDKLVREVVGKGSDEQAYKVREAMLGAMQRGSVGDAVEVVHEMIDLSGQPEPLVMYFVADLIRKLAMAEALAAQGFARSAIAREVKVWGQLERLFFSVLDKLGPGRAMRLLDAVVRADSRGKSGFGTTRLNLECFSVTLADNR